MRSNYNCVAVKSAPKRISQLCLCCLAQLCLWTNSRACSKHSSQQRRPWDQNRRMTAMSAEASPAHARTNPCSKPPHQPTHTPEQQQHQEQASNSNPAPPAVASPTVDNVSHAPLRKANSTCEAGQIVGEYMLGETIGKGTFGMVKIGLHLITGEKVAVKVLEKSRIVQTADVERVAREIKILKRNRHMNVIQVVCSLCLAVTEVCTSLRLSLSSTRLSTLLSAFSSSWSTWTEVKCLSTLSRTIASVSQTQS